ncbi:MAG: hypothetical protein ABI841_02880 [Chloroflexota bacterium]
MTVHIVGLDLGQARDYSALVVTERLTTAPSGPRERTGERRDVVHLERWQLGTPYPVIVDRVVDLMAEPSLADATLVMDATGVGRGIVDLFHAARRDGRLRRYPVAVTITAGLEATGWHVPKRDLVSRLQALLQTGALRIAEGLPLGDVLERELLAFRAKLTAAGNDKYEALREGDHDDLVLALALSCWHRGQGEPRYVGRDGRRFEHRALCPEPY